VTTDLPIEYRNHRCGCTCTIVTQLFKEAGLEPEPAIAGIMMSAILSDTLNFKSATTTQEDKDTVAYLAKIAGIDDVQAYAREMLGASVALRDSTPHEILNRDLKNYEIGKYRFAIGQTNYGHIEEVQRILPEFKANMEKEQAENKLDLLVMLFTDVMGEGSQFVFYGPLSRIMPDVIETVFDEHSGFDPTIISRKQQMMPKLSEIIKHL
jgi:manganese-dependent inorganic pyrophosphatase